MFELSINNLITVSRGDSFKCPLFLNCGTDIDPDRYYIKDGEIVIFAIEYPNQCFENAVIKKEFGYTDRNEHGDIVVSIDGEETKILLSGTYYYEIKALLLDENNKYFVNTVVEKTLFTIV